MDELIIKNYLPPTYFADLPTDQRVKRLVSDWRRAIYVNKELEQALTHEQQRRGALEAVVRDVFESGDVVGATRPEGTGFWFNITLEQRDRVWQALNQPTTPQAAEGEETK